MKTQPPKKLTPPKRIPLAVTAEKEVLPFLERYHKKFGVMPTYREMGEHFDRSYQWALLVINALIKLKLITRPKGVMRGIQLTKKSNKK